MEQVPGSAGKPCARGRQPVSGARWHDAGGFQRCMRPFQGRPGLGSAGLGVGLADEGGGLMSAVAVKGSAGSCFGGLAACALPPDLLLLLRAPLWERVVAGLGNGSAFCRAFSSVWRSRSRWSASLAICRVAPSVSAFCRGLRLSSASTGTAPGQGRSL